MKRLGTTRIHTFGLTALFLFVIVGFWVVVPTVYGTVSNDLPAGQDMEAGGIKDRIDLHLKNLSVAQVVVNKMGAYYPANDTSANNKSVTISKGPIGDRVCNIAEGRVNGHIRIEIKIADGKEANHKVDIDKVCDTDKFYSATFDFPNGQLRKDNKSDYNFALINVWYEATRLNDTAGSDLNYRIRLTGNNKDDGKLALMANDNPTEFGLRSSYSGNPSNAPNDDVKTSVVFGYPCSENVDLADKRRVKIYDADAVFGNTYMWVERNGDPLNLDEYESGPGDKRNIGDWEGGKKRWKLKGSNNDYNMLTMKKDAIIRGAGYKLVLFNNGVDSPTNNPHYNTLSVGTPQDGIYSIGDCEYNLTPSIDVDPDSFVYYPDIRVDSAITKSPAAAPVPEDHSWQLFVVRYNSEPSTRDLVNGATDESPCTQVVPSGGTGCSKIADVTYPDKKTYSIPSYTGGGPYGVGTRVCFFARIQNPTDKLNDDDKWKYSNLDCSVSVKKPRVQFLGGDVRVAGTARSTTYSVEDRTYGSWAEYGMFTLGSNMLAGSGNGLRGGNPDTTDSAWNKLTFANTPSYGGYTPLPSASAAYAYFSGLAATNNPLNAATIPSGVYDNVGTSVGNTLARLPEARGAGVVLRHNGDFRIDRNIIVNNSNLSKASDITQVVIVANNIIIDDSVDRVDAWLITPAGGSINTCRNGAVLKSTVCSTQLTVNGPIYTGQLKLRRTAGGNPPGADQIAAPAERFNLSPEAQLWAYTYANKADYAQTDFIQELPPRY